MSKLGWCVRCGEERTVTAAVEIVDDDPLCLMHARIAHALEVGWGKAVEEPVAAAAAPVRNEPLRRTCSRRCGKEPHKGRCVGEEYLPVTVKPAPVEPQRPPMLTKLPAAVPVVMDSIERATSAAEAAQVQGESGMDVLVCEEIPVSAVPSGRDRNLGRLGALWTRLMVTAPGTALKVKCIDGKHAGHTSRHMKAKARKAGVEIGTRQVAGWFYCWRGNQEEAAR